MKKGYIVFDGFAAWESDSDLAIMRRITRKV